MGTDGNPCRAKLEAATYISRDFRRVWCTRDFWLCLKNRIPDFVVINMFVEDTSKYVSFPAPWNSSMLKCSHLNEKSIFALPQSWPYSSFYKTLAVISFQEFEGSSICNSKVTLIKNRVPRVSWPMWYSLLSRRATVVLSSNTIYDD